MTATTTLLEPSFRRPHRRHRAGGRAVGADPTALGLLGAANRRWLDRPAAVIPARWTRCGSRWANCITLGVGVTAKTLANHKSNVRAALRWFGKEHDVPRHGMPLSADWASIPRQD